MNGADKGTALMLASYNGHAHVVQILIDSGAKLEAVSGNK